MQGLRSSLRNRPASLFQCHPSQTGSWHTQTPPADSYPSPLWGSQSTFSAVHEG